MRFAGFDIGSRTLKLVILNENGMIEEKILPNKYNFELQVKDLLPPDSYDYLVGTGYGRHYFDNWENAETISEIKAFAAGVNWYHKGELTILDIGGQDTKAISLDPAGKMKKFAMNDKCAAGTGRFLEIMAGALNLELSEFGNIALTAKRAEKINNMCTVFAESEVISTLSRGALASEVALGIHNSIVERAIGLLNRVGISQSLVFVGGVAKNPALAYLFRQRLDGEVIVPENAQLMGAWGSAIIARKLWRQNNDLSG
ncbi:MAG: acyl-CoA dehydratase activase [Candidatus Cloacimonetes bacterium]|nr:acyl-CoA dehydratase activase [Candidatus Cloacimonadota bacterium]